MHLKGSFEASSLAGILQLLSQERKTGILRLTCQDAEIQLFIQDGAVIYARSNQQEMRIGALLKSRGIITADQLDDALKSARREKAALGSVLVKRGMVSVKVLKEIITEQAEQVIYNVFLWDQGEFNYTDAEEIPKGLLVTNLDIMNVILEATRRIDEMDVLKKQIPGDSAVFAMSEKAAKGEDIKLSPVEWRILSLFNGQRTVIQVINASGYDKYSGYKMLHSLITLGLAEMLQESASPATEYAAVVEVYDDVLREVRKHMEDCMRQRPFVLVDNDGRRVVVKDPDQVKYLRENEVVRWTKKIMDQARPDSRGASRNLLAGFSVYNPPDDNIEALVKSMKDYPDAQRGRTFLSLTFKEYLGNVMDRLPDLVGVDATRELLWELDRMLRYMARKAPHLMDQKDLFAEVSDALKRGETRIRDKEDVAFKAGGVFAVRVEKAQIEE